MSKPDAWAYLRGSTPPPRNFQKSELKMKFFLWRFQIVSVGADIVWEGRGVEFLRRLRFFREGLKLFLEEMRCFFRRGCDYFRGVKFYSLITVSISIEP